MRRSKADKEILREAASPNKSCLRSEGTNTLMSSSFLRLAGLILSIIGTEWGRIAPEPNLEHAPRNVNK